MDGFSLSKNRICYEGNACTVYVGYFGYRELAVKILNEGEEDLCLDEEAMITQELSGHPNIIRFFDYGLIRMEGRYGLCTDFEYCDLRWYMQNNRMLHFDMQYIFVQLMEGLRWCHLNGYLHCDIKPENLLLSREKHVRIGDFGLSRKMLRTRWSKHPDGNVVTWNYRPPEIFAGVLNYGPEIDIWSAGCVLAEMLRKGALLFVGKDERELLDNIFKLCGTPYDPGFSMLACFGGNVPHYRRRLLKCFTDNSVPAVILLDRMLAIVPLERPSAERVLKHDFCVYQLSESDIEGMRWICY